jgi:Uma2 family endonuclease
MAEPHHPVPGRMTVEQFFALPDDGKRYELLDGVVEEMTAPNTKHQRVIGRLYVLLVRMLQEAGLGEVLLSPFDVVLGDRTVLQPDLLFISNEDAGILNARNARGAPTLVIEVLSESTRRKDVLRKRRLYASAGVAWYWIVDPEIDRIECLRLDGDDYAVAALFDAPIVGEPPAFPSVRIDLAILFA